MFVSGLVRSDCWFQGCLEAGVCFRVVVSVCFRVG